MMMITTAIVEVYVGVGDNGDIAMVIFGIVYLVCGIVNLVFGGVKLVPSVFPLEDYTPG